MLGMAEHTGYILRVCCLSKDRSAAYPEMTFALRPSWVFYFMAFRGRERVIYYVCLYSEKYVQRWGLMACEKRPGTPC